MDLELLKMKATLSFETWGTMRRCVTARKTEILEFPYFNPLTPKLNLSAKHSLTRIFTGNFASWAVNFFNIYVKNQQIHNYSFRLLIMYGSSYMFRHYIAIIKERS
jgi:hypothetical protein